MRTELRQRNENIRLDYKLQHLKGKVYSEIMTFLAEKYFVSKALINDILYSRRYHEKFEMKNQGD